MINSMQSFKNFDSALLLLFHSSTGENWFDVMYDCVSSAGGLAVIYFLFFIVLVQFVMLNLFVLVILQQFEENFINEDNPLSNF